MHCESFERCKLQNDGHVRVECLRKFSVNANKTIRRVDVNHFTVAAK